MWKQNNALKVSPDQKFKHNLIGTTHLKKIITLISEKEYLKKNIYTTIYEIIIKIVCVYVDERLVPGHVERISCNLT